MKNLIIGLFAALLMSAGLVGVAGTTATAADCGDVYTPCGDSNTRVAGPSRVERGNDATFCVTVQSNGGRDLRGSVTFTVTRDNGGFRYSVTRSINGVRCFDTPVFRTLGGYTARARFVASGNFRNSSDTKAFSVVRHR